jgi:lipoate-protein ligase A
VRRSIGGRAVWHARELTYSVAAPVALLGSLALAYETLHRLLADAMRDLGAVPALAGAPARAARVDAGACFASPAGGEVVVGNRKLVGSAQVRQGSAFLQHGSLLLEDDQRMVQDVTRGDPPASQGEPLNRILGRPVSFEEMAGSIVSRFEAWAGPLRTGPPESELGARAGEHQSRFQSPQWTWSR